MIAQVSTEINKAPIDVAFVGVGENGHLAFNDPPADFDTNEAYIVVNLDEACRRQQLGEGWFSSLVDVPTQAISMTVRQILKADNVLAIVPDARKAKAIKACFGNGIHPDAPSSILQSHPRAIIYLDTESASLLSEANLKTYADEYEELRKG
jgi:glucosamine-6-phosphate deaminase